MGKAQPPIVDKVPPPPTPSQVDAIERARAFVHAEELAPNKVHNVPPGMIARAIDVVGLPANMVLGLRARYQSAGFDPAPEGHTMFCPGCRGAEIWIAPAEVEALLFQRRLALKARAQARRNATQRDPHEQLVREITEKVRAQLP